MNPAARRIQRTYLVLTLLTTLASSLIWGINTLFLLDAGLSPTAAFSANAFYTAGQVLFEVPTGVLADTRGRRASFLLGTLVLGASTAAYWLAWQMAAPFWFWAVASALIGVGFTFFSGATEAWLVDALRASGYDDGLEPVFGRAQVVGGVAMLSGSVAGGLVAQYTDLGVPYLLRSAALVVTFLVALGAMHDVGFTPKPGRSPLEDVRRVLRASLRYGLGNPAVRWVMLAELFLGGVVIYAYYAVQPYLLELWGDEQAYGIAGLAVAIFAAAQIVGGVVAPHVRGLFRRRTSVLLVGTLAVSVLLALLGVTRSFWVAVLLLVAQGLVFAAIIPIRQAYLNDLIPSEQRATVLSFDMLLDSAGGIVWQPALGRVAQVSGYPASYLVSGGIQLLALPFLALARGQDHPADAAAGEPAAEPAT